jgi:hypothetical protein
MRRFLFSPFQPKEHSNPTSGTPQENKENLEEETTQIYRSEE